MMVNKKTSRLERLVKNLEPITFPHDGNCRDAPTGEPYVTIMSQGIKPEGATTEFFLTDVEAVDRFEKELIKYFHKTEWNISAPPAIYWRVRPTLVRCRYEYLWDYARNVNYDKRERKRQYTVRCRVLISDKYIKGE